MSNANVIISTGKRKKAVATAIIKPGNGKIRVNGVPAEIIPNVMARLKILEPILLIGKEIRNLIDIEVKVNGGGVMGQASAIRTAIARGLISYFKCNDNSEECKKRNEIAERIKQIFEEYDRSMLSGDYRRTEPEKYMRYGARRGWQTSYR